MTTQQSYSSSYINVQFKKCTQCKERKPLKSFNKGCCSCKRCLAPNRNKKSVEQQLQYLENQIVSISNYYS